MEATSLEALSSHSAGMPSCVTAEHLVFVYSKSYFPLRTEPTIRNRHSDIISLSLFSFWDLSEQDIQEEISTEDWSDDWDMAADKHPQETLNAESEAQAGRIEEASCFVEVSLSSLQLCLA
jgi:hypothetical protein